MRINLQGRVAIVTGASRGLGKSIALALAGAGAGLALVGRDATTLEPVVAAAREMGADAQAYPTDVSDEEQVIRLEHQVVDRFGPVHILVNNAGVAVRKQVPEFTLQDWNSVIATNLTSAFLICRSFIPHMKGQGYGRIINMTSIMGHISFPGRAAYSASKAGLLGFTRTLALELAVEGITAVGISPGPFATEMVRPVMSDPEKNAEFLRNIPLGRWGNPEDIGQLALFLCSDAAAFITGTDIVIDGGWCAQ